MFFCLFFLSFYAGEMEDVTWVFLRIWILFKWVPTPLYVNLSLADSSKIILRNTGQNVLKRKLVVLIENKESCVSGSSLCVFEFPIIFRGPSSRFSHSISCLSFLHRLLFHPWNVYLSLNLRWQYLFSLMQICPQFLTSSLLKYFDYISKDGASQSKIKSETFLARSRIQRMHNFG